MRKSKYGLIKKCPHCNSEFETKRRFLTYCSTPCKNPINRPGHMPWNKGVKFNAEQKEKLNMEGLKKGHGWMKNKNHPSYAKTINSISSRMRINNPNADGRLNNLRPKNPTTDLLKHIDPWLDKQHIER